MTLIDPESVFISNYPQIDEAHAEFVTLLNQMQTASNMEFKALFETLLTHTEAHFEEENNLMIQSKFPASAEHQAEHRRVLGELKQFQKRLNKGMVTFAKAYALEKLPDWFKLHISTMDGALVAHLNIGSYQ